MSRDALFDLAVNRALIYISRLGFGSDSESFKTQLQAWYETTRFAYRIPLDNVVKILKTYPAEGQKRSAKNSINTNPQTQHTRTNKGLQPLVNSESCNKSTILYYWQGGKNGQWQKGKNPNP